LKNFLAFALLLSLVFYISCHARLSNLADWNPNFSKTSPCGGGAQPTKKAGTLVIGNTVVFTWQIIASDGVGTVTAAIDTTGGTTFNTPLALTGTQPTAIGTYTFSATVPSLTCTGASTDGSKLCTIQLQSSSGWFSCTSLEIVATGSQVVTIPQKCVYPSSLTFCSMVNGQNVNIPDLGQDLASYDQTVQNTFYNTLYNPLVFQTPNISSCGSYYKKIILWNQFSSLCTTNNGWM